MTKKKATILIAAILCGCNNTCPPVVEEGTGFVTISDAGCDGVKHGRSVTHVGYKGTEAVYDHGQVMKSTVFDKDGKIEREISEDGNYEFSIIENVEQMEPLESN